MKNKLMIALMVLSGCGETLVTKTKYVEVEVEVLVPVQPEAEPAVKCQVFTDLNSVLLSQANNTSKYLPLTHSVKGNMEIGLDNLSLTEEANDLVAFAQFEDTDAEAITNSFALRCKFQYEVKNPGTHVFTLNSDDGSQLFVNGSRIIDNGGAHGMTAKNGSVSLPVGIHDMMVLYYEGNGPKGLLLSVQPPAVVQAPEQL